METKLSWSHVIPWIHTIRQLAMWIFHVRSRENSDDTRKPLFNIWRNCDLKLGVRLSLLPHVQDIDTAKVVIPSSNVLGVFGLSCGLHKC